MSDKKHWIIRLVPAIGFVAGIIMASVGGIMVLSSSAKLVLFDENPRSYISIDNCRYDYSKERVDDKPYLRTAEEQNLCVKERKKEDTKRFKNDEKQDIIDGLSLLLVGFILLFSFRKRK